MTKRTYQQYCPVAEALDLVGERWTLLIVRELLTGPQRYTDLKQAMPTMASNLLGDRLSELVDAGIVERLDTDDARARSLYGLTPAGQALDSVIASLARWGMQRLPLPADDLAISPRMVPRAALLAYLRPRLAGAERFVVETVLDGVSTTITVDGGRGSIHAGPPVREAPDVTIEGAARALLLVRLGIRHLRCRRRRRLDHASPAPTRPSTLPRGVRHRSSRPHRDGGRHRRERLSPPSPEPSALRPCPDSPS